MLQSMGATYWVRAISLSIFLGLLASVATNAQEKPAEGAAEQTKGQAQELIQQALTVYPPAGDSVYVDRDGVYEPPEDAQGRDAQEARRLMEQAAGAGSEKAQALLGYMLEAGIGGPQDFSASRRHLALSRDRGALWRLGYLVEHGKGGPPDLERARELYKQSGKLGQIDALYEYARMVELGIGGPGDPERARKLYEEVVEWCHGDGADRYSMMLMRGIGGPVDHKRAAQLQLRAVTCNNKKYFQVPVAIANPQLLDRQMIQEMQLLLEKRGRYQGPTDGQYNEALRAALLEVFK